MKITSEVQKELNIPISDFFPGDKAAGVWNWPLTSN